MASNSGFLAAGGSSSMGSSRAPATKTAPLPAASPPGLAPFAGAVFRELSLVLSAPNSLAILSASANAAGIRRDHLAPRHLPEIVAHVQASFDFFGVPEDRRARCLTQLRALADSPNSLPGSGSTTVPIARENDIVRARLAGRALCRQLGFSEARTGSVVAAISELGRNIFKHAGTGSVTVRWIEGRAPGVEIVARDCGPGIADVSALLSHDSASRAGAGAGLRSIRAQVDFFDIVSRADEGTTVTLRKLRGR